MPERKAYIQSIESLLGDIDREIEKVREKAAASGEPSRIRGIETELIAMRKEIEAQLDVVKRADTSDWKDFRLGIDSAREKLTMNVTHAMKAIERKAGRS
jgi:hypothetical protein